MLGHRDVSQGELGQEAGCIGEHQNAMPTPGRCREGKRATETWQRGAFVLQSQAGNLCSRTDTELELGILWIKPRIKRRMQDSADKMFKGKNPKKSLTKMGQETEQGLVAMHSPWKERLIVNEKV